MPAPVVVVGGGVAGLVTARDLAIAGREVVLLEARDRPGGCIGVHEVDGLRLDAGAESYATRSPAVPRLIEELDLAEDVVLPAAGAAWVHGPHGAAPLPRTGALGIPGTPWAADVRRAVGVLGAARAGLDRWLPARVGLGAEPVSLGQLVRARQGRRVLDRLVDPVVTGVHSARPDDVDLGVLPGLRELVLEHGSLAGAVTAMRAAAPAGAAVAGLRGGMNRLVTALWEDSVAQGVDVRTGTRAESLERAGGTWTIGTTAGPVVASQVVVALDNDAAVRLLAPHAPAATAMTGPPNGVVLATLVVDAPVLDQAPRGTGVLVALGAPGVRAKALTHATAKWAWLAQTAGPGRHVLRLSYGWAGRPAGPSAEASPEVAADLGDDLRETALADAATLLGVPLELDQVRGFGRTTWRHGLNPTRPGHGAQVARLRAELTAQPGLHAAGAWLAGTGLAAVVADARRVAASLV
ncbi:FAD-dependent oxidoreductase [Actinotalea sp. BY-33]|uniref:FAD-dependent oxidoreductase n=1 Tax=Actinotalea soli TaxID=2819234 RepID=A0A939LNI1_9CELL|nr:FAD-dependent oxidoreductase [Actinotalea soli]MBO1751066.1 FAD-dependent oxidoreductase [Actinotalea soli]